MLQHLNNLNMTLGRGLVYSPVTTVIFRAAPSVYLSAILAAALFMPIGDMEPLFHFRGDMVVFAGLLALSRIAIILAALDTGSSFEGMGASREAMYGALIEPALFLALGTAALITGHDSFEAIFLSLGRLTPELVIILLLLAFVLFRIMTVEAGRIPVDDPRTHLELTMIHEVMVLDYSGIDMGMITLGHWIKTGLLTVLAANTVSIAMSLDSVATAFVALGMGMAVGLTESLTARNKLARNTTYILITAAVALILFIVTLMLQNNIKIG